MRLPLPPDLGLAPSFLGSPVISERFGPLFIRERSHGEANKAARKPPGWDWGGEGRSMGTIPALQEVPGQRRGAASLESVRREWAGRQLLPLSYGE